MFKFKVFSKNDSLMLIFVTSFFLYATALKYLNLDIQCVKLLSISGILYMRFARFKVSYSLSCYLLKLQYPMLLEESNYSSNLASSVLKSIQNFP